MLGCKSLFNHYNAYSAFSTQDGRYIKNNYSRTYNYNSRFTRMFADPFTSSYGLFTNSLGENGLVGLIALAIIMYLFQRKRVGA